MLELSRASGSDLRIDRFPLEVDEMVRSVVESLTPTARERRQTIIINSKTSGVWISADRDRLVQVLSNLITNACKYSPDRSSIEIHTCSDGGSLEIKVIDNGYGMSEEDLQMLFSPFFRSDREEIRNESGTGLGMTISKTLVELHNGEISVESKMGGGTIVQIQLPGVVDRPSSD